jgi:hypothetical protein
MKHSDTLRDVARRLRHLQPHHRDPERFHLERDQLERDVRRVAADLGRTADAVDTAGPGQSR